MERLYKGFMSSISGMHWNEIHPKPPPRLRGGGWGWGSYIYI
jgi:hypothetical protein